MVQLTISFADHAAHYHLYRSLPLDPNLIQFNSVYSLLLKTHLKWLHINEETVNDKITSCKKITKLRALRK